MGSAAVLEESENPASESLGLFKIPKGWDTGHRGAGREALAGTRQGPVVCGAQMPSTASAASTRSVEPMPRESASYL